MNNRSKRSDPDVFDFVPGESARDPGKLAHLWWSIPAACLILLGLAAPFLGQAGEPLAGSTLDASIRGHRAAYLLLEKLDYPIRLARRPSSGGETIRIVLEPTRNSDSFATLRDWVQDGGLLILADGSTAFAADLGVALEEEATRSPDDAANGAKKAPGGGKGSSGAKSPKKGPAAAGVQAVESIDVSASRIADVRTIAVAEDHVIATSGPPGDRLVASTRGPVVTRLARGKGEIWVIHYPSMFNNSLLKRDDNAILLCRLVTQALTERPGEVAFDDFFHGLGDRPGAIELLFTPPMIWVTLQACLLTAIVVWRNAGRFGEIRSSAPPRRRSKEEFLNALAGLLERRRDYGDAYRTVRDDLKLSIARRTGLPASSPPRALADEAARRYGCDADEPAALLEADRPISESGPQGFLKDINTMESYYHE